MTVREKMSSTARQKRREWPEKLLQLDRAIKFKTYPVPKSEPFKKLTPEEQRIAQEWYDWVVTTIRSRRATRNSKHGDN